MPSVSREELRRRAQAWLAEDPDPVTRGLLRATLDADDEKALIEGFAEPLQFGTAGLRGVLGPGPGRMNRAVVRRVSCGLGRHLLETIDDAAVRGVVVGHDARHLSVEFARDTAEALAGLGVKVHLFPHFVPTPLVAVAVRALGAAAGVMITASHNPPEYNGYKVYWENGAQIIPPVDAGISAAIEAIGSLQEVPLAGLDQARAAHLVVDIDERILDDYLDDILRLRRHPEVPCRLEIVYTPLHGVGGEAVEKVFHRAGYAPLHVVEEQFTPDGDFPTVRFPNPEEEGAMDLALARAETVDAELVLANDPDADRLAVAVRDPAGGYRMLTGDEIGTVLGHYLLTENLPEGIHPLLMTTIVSSRLLSKMAKERGAAYDETLTGFKWIANVSQRHRRERGEQLLLGYEEALGYSVGMVTADKDGISAALVFAEVTAWYKEQGRSVMEVLEEIYRRHGLHLTRQKSLVLPGLEGAARIAAIMDAMRRHPPERIGERPVSWMLDYLEGRSRAIGAPATAGGDRPEAAPPGPGAPAPSLPEGLPASNVLALFLDDGTRILLRPSGTEPKIKFYFEIVHPLDQDEPLAQAETTARARMDRLVDELLELVEGL